MKRLVAILVMASAAVALARPALVPVTLDKTTVSLPAGYQAKVGERCLSAEGAGSLIVFRTLTTQADFETREAAGDAKRVARDKVVCFEHTQPGENARCMVTTDAGRWVTQFVSFGKGYSKIGGAEAMQAIVTSIKGWDPKPYDGTYPGASDCPA